jgi:hypothetical protein
MGQVLDERLTHIDRYWQAVDTVPLSPDDHLPAPPVNAAQFEPSDLGCPQAKTSQERQNREITKPGRLASIAAVQKRSHI